MVHSVHSALASHPANPARFHERIDVTLSQPATGGLGIRYAIHGLNLDLRVPTPHAPAPADALWRHTCCEIFIGQAGSTRYREFNFSPSGQSAAYDFLDYRQRAPATQNGPAPSIQVSRAENLLQLDVMLPAAALPLAENLHLALAVVLEAGDGSLGYWALAHPAGKADFHHHAGFVLHLGSTGFRPTHWP
ncbi:MAG: DOMON-like domain-containing protein [Rhodocyclaceae bacterium]|nr:DOMON-like domain-containing protein [Rhodocyclaceae bacterium]